MMNTDRIIKKKNLLKSFFIITICVICVPISFAQNKIIDSLLTVIKADKADTNKVIHLCQLTKELQLTGDLKKGLIYGAEAIELANKLDFKKGIAQANNNIGNIYYWQSDYPRALDYYLKALKLDEQLNDKGGMAIRFGNIGGVYRAKGNYPKALDFLIKALALDEKLGDKQSAARHLGSIGAVYYHQNDFLKALDYYTKGLKMDEELGYKRGVGDRLGNMANVYLSQNDYPKALDYYFRSLKITQELGHKNSIAIGLGNIGIAFNGQKDYPKALDYFSKALKMSEELGDKNGIARNLSNIGSVYTLIGKYKEAEQYLKKAIIIYDSAGTLDYLRLVYEELSFLYDTTGRYKLALINYKKAIALKDTIFSQENKKELVRKEMNFEFDKKEALNKAEVEKKESELLIQQLLLNQKSAVIYILIISSALIIIIAALLIRQMRANANNKTIELQQKLLRSQMNPHFIFNALLSIQNYMFENNPDNAAVYLSKFAVLMRLILENSREEYIPLESEIKTLEHYLELQQMRFENRFNYLINVDETIDIDFIAIPPMLAQPFIENAIEHGLAGKKENGKITVSFKQEDGNIIFEVEDNGVGILDSSAKQQGTKSNHRSLATTITKERLDMLNKNRRNKIRYEMVDLGTLGNRETTGTRVVFSIPFKHL